MLELRHYRYVVAVAEDLNFSSAARRLGISTPTLSVQVKHVEDLVGTLIFHRSSQKVSLTHAGSAFVEAARSVLAAARQAELAGQQAVRGERGEVKIGYVGSAAYGGFLQSLLHSFTERYPLVLVTANEHHIDELPQLVTSREIDLALVRPPFEKVEKQNAIVLTSDHYVVALPDGHPCAAHNLPVPTQDLKGTRFIVPDQHETATREVGNAGGFEPRIESRQRTLIAVLTQVSIGRSAAVVPNSVTSNLMIPGIAYRELADLHIPTGIVGLFLSGALPEVVSKLVQTAGELRQEP